MTCGDLQEALSAFSDSSLDAGERVRLAEHLDACAACRSEWLGVEKARALLRTRAPHRMPKRLRERIAQMIGADAPEAEETRRPAPAFGLFDALRPRWAVAAAAGLLLWAGMAAFEAPQEDETIPIKALLAEHVRASRKAADIHRSALVSAPYEAHWTMRGAGR